MYRDCTAQLSMSRLILGESCFDDSAYSCKILRYIPEKECIYIVVEKTELPAFSLDALYDCKIQTTDEVLGCQGFIRERYISNQGNIIVFEIQNGFYKNPVNKI